MQKKLSLCCYVAGLLLCTAALLWSLLGTGLSTSRFCAAQQKNTVVSRETATVFARNTMAYLRGEAESWDVSPLGEELAPSPEFTAHMASVKQMAENAKKLGVLLPALAMALLMPTFFRRGSFSSGAWLLGVLTSLLCCGACALWAVLDFSGFWGWLHARFIPDGIFSAGEKIMVLFPAELFAGYLLPFGIVFILSAGVLAFIPWGAKQLHRFCR